MPNWKKVIVSGSIAKLANETFISGHITASGTVKAEHFISTDDALIGDDLVVNGDIDLDGSIDVNGTANLDVVDIDGAVSIAAATTIATNNKIQFRDTGLYIHSSTDGQLDIVADTEIQIAATTIDINGAINASGEIIAASLDISGNADIDGNLTGLNNVTSTNFIIGGHTINDVDQAGEFVDADDHLMSAAAINDRFAQINANTTGTATNATNAAHVLITDNEDTNEHNQLTFIEGAGGGGANRGLEADGHLTYNPSKGLVIAPNFSASGHIHAVGDITGSTGKFDAVISDDYTIGAHTINDIDITSEFVDANDHLMSSKAIGARFAQKNADTTGTATNATNAAHVLITDNESTNEENQITFIEGAAGGTANRGLEADGNLTYNPSTGTVTATIFKGNGDFVDIDVDGTANLDAVDIDGNVDVAGSLTLSEYIYHSGDTTNYHRFLASRQIFVVGNASSIDLNNGVSTFGSSGGATTLQGSSLAFTGAATFSGDVSSSGHLNIVGDITSSAIIKAEHLHSTDDAQIDDDLTVGGDIDLEGSIDVNGTANLDVVDIDGAVDMASTLTVAGNLLIASNLQHVGDDNNELSFGTDTQDFRTNNSSRLDISNSGVRLGGANARVTTVLDEDAMGSDSATSLATQQSIKAYVDANAGFSGNKFATDLKIGRDADNLIDFTVDNKIRLRVEGVNEYEFLQNVFRPITSDGAALGGGSNMWSDLFLASGAVINFNNGDVTMTHSSNLLTIGGGHLKMADGKALYAGDGLDLGIYHVSNNSYIENITGDLEINNASRKIVHSTSESVFRGNISSSGHLNVVGDITSSANIKGDKINCTTYIIGGHTINDIDRAGEFVDSSEHILTSAAANDRFAQINADTTGTATNATNAAHVLITDNESTNEENQITFIEGAGGGGSNRGLEADGDLTYNPSTGTVSATIFKGNIDAVDGDFDGTLEADAITVGGTALNTVIAGVTVTNSTNAAHVLVTDNESTDEENQITFIEGAGGGGANRGLEADGNLTYNPSAGSVTATLFKGNYAVGGHTINDIDITSEFVDDNAHIMSSKAIGARFAQKNADTTGTATNATNAAHVLITDNESTDEENQITFIEGAAGGTANRGLEADGNLTYNPSSGTVTATVFKGNIDAVDGDFDGTLEADAITVGGTALNTVIAGVTVTNATTAAVATTVTITDNESTNENNPLVFVAGGDLDGGNLGLESDGTTHYNPSTGTITATIFKGNIDAVDGDFDGTLEADAITVGGTNILTGGIITTLGTIAQDTILFQSSNADDPLLTIENNANDATGARLLLLKDKGAAGADNDEVGEIIFAGDNDAQQQTNFAKLRGLISDASDGAEGGKFEVRVATHDGEMQPGLTIQDGDAEDELDVTIGKGASSVFTISGTTAVGGTITPSTSNGAALGTGTNMFSDLFLASGAVINFNNGDITLTHTSNHLTVAGGTLVVPTLNLGANDHLMTDGANIIDSSDNTMMEFNSDAITFSCSDTTINGKTTIAKRKFNISTTTNNNLSQGDVTYMGGEGTIATGDIVYLDTSGNWQKAQANSTTKSIGLLGIALGNNAGNNGILLRGMFTLDHDVGNNQGIPLYLSDTTAGQAIIAAPDTSGDIVRIIGYNLGDNDEIWFSPDNTFVEVA